ncbi:MAG: hypothetical protein LAO55_23855 [Acidobacteriia bacterium]|nr:hypothetical protein [Terriglobia bacterium]
MNHQDPTSGELNGLVGDFAELSVDDIAALNALNREESEQIAAQEPTAAVSIPAVGPAPLIPIPIPLPLPKRAVSGRYRGSVGSFQLELRVDVDGVRPQNRVSGDFYSFSGGTLNYVGSFIVGTPAIAVTATQVTIRGLGSYTFSAGAPVVQVTIQRRSLLQPPAPAEVRFFTTAGAPGATYNCSFESRYFRTVRLETDRVSDVTTPVFANYNTGLLPSGGPARNLSVVSAYAEAGIEMIPTSGSDVINIAEAHAGASWSDAELHDSMTRHFSVFRNVPQWTVWQAVCQNHDLGPGLLGIMFDQLGPQRQGCAVFHRGLGGVTPQQLRVQLQTYVHELGHCFNLLHSWQKSFATPPAVDRPTSLSWMNYPWRYPLGGEPAFWSAFPFQFDTGELVHLRHAFRNNVIMGGNPFISGAGEVNPEIMADPISDQSGLQLEIFAASTGFALGEPVVVRFGLEGTDRRGSTVHPYLHPNMMLTNIVIAKPNGRVVAYDPYIDHLMAGTERNLAQGSVIQDSAYIGYGKGGLYFDQPGTYQIRAVYNALDGSRVLSNVLNVCVKYPVTAQDQEMADLLMGQEQGALFYLLGSDSESLRRGNAAFEKALDKHADHPLADYVRLVHGINAARTYKAVDDSNPKRCTVRPANLAQATKLLTNAAAAQSPVDDITKGQCLDRLVTAKRTAGDEQGASEVTKMAHNIGASRKAKVGAH